MKMNLIMPCSVREPETVASFGGAKLMRKNNGDYYILGGTSDDRADAKEWVSIFMHEASISFAPPLATRDAA